MRLLTPGCAAVFVRVFWHQNSSKLRGFAPEVPVLRYAGLAIAVTAANLAPAADTQTHRARDEKTGLKSRRQIWTFSINGALMDLADVKSTHAHSSIHRPSLPLANWPDGPEVNGPRMIAEEPAKRHTTRDLPVLIIAHPPLRRRSWLQSLA